MVIIVVSARHNKYVLWSSKATKPVNDLEEIKTLCMFQLNIFYQIMDLLFEFYSAGQYYFGHNYVCDKIFPYLYPFFTPLSVVIVTNVIYLILHTISCIVVPNGLGRIKMCKLQGVLKTQSNII